MRRLFLSALLFAAPAFAQTLGVLTPTAGIVTGVNGNNVQIFGSSTSWTPGMPGSPIFTISGGSCTGISITAQTVESSGLAELTVNSGSTNCTATITDPSTGQTVTVPVRAPITWYVNTSTGGDRFSPFNGSGECNGQASTPYVSGTNQPCPFNDGRLLWDDPHLGISQQHWTFAGGDTVIFQTNTQIAGSDNTTNFCNGIGGDCVPPDLPSGSSTNKTTLEGANFASCSGAKNFINSLYLQQAGDPAKQVVLTAESTLGTRPFYGLGIATTQHAILRCIDLIGNGGSTTLGIFLGGAIPPTNFDNTLQDVTIEGFFDSGMKGNIGGSGQSLTLTRTTVQFNGLSGINLDPGSGQFSTGDLVTSYASIFANGCMEEFPVVHASFPAAVCRDDTSTGYGDGFGTPTGPLNTTWDHALAAYNTQDGIDCLHCVNGVHIMTNSQSYGNMGATLKAGPGVSATYINDIFLANCQRMSAPIGGNSTFNSLLTDWCRASDQNAMVALPTAQEVSGGITSSGTAVTGTGTHFTTELAPGNTVACGCFPPSGARTIASITDDTHLTLSTAFPSNVTPLQNLLILPSGTSSSNTVLKVYHSTFVGYGPTVWDVPCQTGLTVTGAAGQEGVDTGFCAGAAFTFEDNIIKGYTNSSSFTVSPQMWGAIQPTVEDYNLYFNLNTTYGTGAHDLNADPLLTSQPSTPIGAESTLDSFNFSLSSSSPAKAAGLPIAGVTTDFLGVTYNVSTPSMGALQFTLPSSPSLLNFGAKLSSGATLH
jgi:hypothetical protein